MRGMGLKNYFFLSLAIAVFLVAISAGVLWRAASRMRENAVFMQNSIESVSTVQTLRMSLDIHRRQSLLHDLRTSKVRDLRRSEEEANLYASIATAASLASTADEIAIVQETRRALDVYLEASERLRHQGVHGTDLWRMTTPQYEMVMKELQELIDFKVAETLDVERKTIQETVGLKRVMVVSFAVIGVVAAGLLFLFMRYFYLPLMQLRGVIARYTPSTQVPSLAGPALKEIVEISSAFRDLDQQLKKQRDQRLLLLSSIAHDLKNPLGAIEMSLGLLSQESTASGRGWGAGATSDSFREISNEDDRSELFAIMHRQLNQLKRLVDDVLDTTRIESGHVELRKVERDMREVVNDSVMLFKSASPSHRILGDLPTAAVMASFDPHRIGQVLNNLISNAIKYSPKGGDVEVRLSLQSKDLRDFAAVISVSDSGVGLRKEELSKIFEPFHRASSHRDSIKGVGLGLSSARRIVEAHHGRIEVKSEYGKGSTFSIYLPALVAERSVSLPAQVAPV